MRRRVRAPGLQGGGFAEVVGRVPSPGGTEAIIMRIAENRERIGCNARARLKFAEFAIKIKK